MNLHFFASSLHADTTEYSLVKILFEIRSVFVDEKAKS